MSRPRTVLILEDNKAAGEICRIAFRRSGMEAVVFQSLPEARAFLRTALPDALLVDVRVAEYNGLQLALLFRSMSPKATIVVTTGYDDPTIREEARQLEAIFVLKPADIDDVVSLFAAIH